MGHINYVYNFRYRNLSVDVQFVKSKEKFWPSMHNLAQILNVRQVSRKFKLVILSLLTSQILLILKMISMPFKNYRRLVRVSSHTFLAPHLNVVLKPVILMTLTSLSGWAR